MARQRSGRVARLVRFLALAVVLILLLPYALAPLYLFVPPVSIPMLWRWATGARVERAWMPIQRMAPALPLAVIVAEDGRFCSHHGIDFRELAQAIEDVDDVRNMRGGSTITQQDAKNLFLWQSRSIARKALELPLALWLEFVLGKRRLLEIYLNVAEWGANGEFGAEAGARRAFGKSASELNAREAALLAAVLPNPHLRDARRPGPALRRLAGIYQARAEIMMGADACVGGARRDR